MNTIRITGWKPGLQTISMIVALRGYANLGLTEAKSIVDRVLAGEVVEVQAYDARCAQKLLADLMRLGAIAVIGPAA
jgi:hypothetical protein